jgi:hypothetical protein
MKDDKYEIEGLAPDHLDLFVVRKGKPRLKIATAVMEKAVRVITIALMELEKNSRGIDWDSP